MQVSIRGAPELMQDVSKCLSAMLLRRCVSAGREARCYKDSAQGAFLSPLI